jgi:sulfide:quinone oxidoreductase
VRKGICVGSPVAGRQHDVTFEDSSALGGPDAAYTSPCRFELDPDRTRSAGAESHHASGRLLAAPQPRRDQMSDKNPIAVVIAGGGVAALEAAFALRTLAPERTSIQIIAPNVEFSYRPMTVGEPFAHAPAAHYPLAEIAADVAAELIVDEFAWVDRERRIAYTASGQELHYDALLLALGARMRAPFDHGLTIDDARMDEQLHGLVQDVEGGDVHSIAFVSPARIGWPLPLYELALMTAARAYDMGVKVDLSIVTPEQAPLAIFGEEASQAVAGLLADAEITVIASAHAQVPEPGRVIIQPGERSLDADRVIALPELFGPAVRGLRSAEHGFIPTDAHGRVVDAERIYAAGDATDFAVKHGGLAAQQADAAAESIAALAGVSVIPTAVQTEIYAMLMTGREPLYFSARISGSRGFGSQIIDRPTSKTTGEPASTPPAKIAAHYLAPYLEQRARVSIAP